MSGFGIVIMSARFQYFGKYPMTMYPLNILVNKRTADLGKNCIAVLKIWSIPGALRFGRFFIIFVPYLGM